MRAHRDAGMPLVKLLEQFGQRIGDGEIGIAHPQRARLADADTAREINGGLHPVQHTLTALAKGTACIGQTHEVLRAVEQRDLQLRLEMLDRAGERRLRDMQMLRGAAEIQILGEDQKIADMAQTDLHDTFYASETNQLILYLQIRPGYPDRITKAKIP